MSKVEGLVLLFEEAMGDGVPSLPGAVCAQTDPEIFFPEKGGSPRQAKALCATCPRLEECRSWALESLPWGTPGIYGGMTERERRLENAKRNKEAS